MQNNTLTRELTHVTAKQKAGESGKIAMKRKKVKEAGDKRRENEEKERV